MFVSRIPPSIEKILDGCKQILDEEEKKKETLFVQLIGKLNSCPYDDDKQIRKLLAQIHDECSVSYRKMAASFNITSESIRCMPNGVRLSRFIKNKIFNAVKAMVKASNANKAQTK